MGGVMWGANKYELLADHRLTLLSVSRHSVPIVEATKKADTLTAAPVSGNEKAP